MSGQRESSELRSSHRSALTATEVAAQDHHDGRSGMFQKRLPLVSTTQIPAAEKFTVSLLI